MTITPLLIVHVGAGGLAILSGATAVSVRKGEWLHRVFGTVFFLAMLTMSAAGAWLAVFLPPGAPVVVPQSASAVVGILTFYLVATAWATVRQGDGRAGAFERIGLVAASSVAVALATMGFLAVRSATGLLEGAPPAPYFIFASFAAFAAALDLSVIRRGGVAGASRIARHLWRMCFALFFASAFFFLGQQKVMPAFMQHSPFLFVPALAPLAVMIFWLVRVRMTGAFKSAAAAAETR